MMMRVLMTHLILAPLLQPCVHHGATPYRCLESWHDTFPSTDANLARGLAITD